MKPLWYLSSVQLTPFVIEILNETALGDTNPESEEWPIVLCDVSRLLALNWEATQMGNSDSDRYQLFDRQDRLSIVWV